MWWWILAPHGGDTHTRQPICSATVLVDDYIVPSDCSGVCVHSAMFNDYIHAQGKDTNMRTCKICIPMTQPGEKYKMKAPMFNICTDLFQFYSQFWGRLCFSVTLQSKLHNSFITAILCSNLCSVYVVIFKLNPHYRCTSCRFSSFSFQTCAKMTTNKENIWFLFLKKWNFPLHNI